jgi:hypothetical protein
MQASAGIFRVIHTGHELYQPMCEAAVDHVAMENFYRLMLNGQLMA